MSDNPQIKVCHFSSVHKAFDIRIFHKELTFISKSGYLAYFVVPHTHDEEINNIKIISVKKLVGSRLLRFTKTVWTVYKKAKSLDANVYQFHDPELIPVSILLKLSGKKVIYDVHENLPADIIDKGYLGNYITRIIVSKSAAILEKIAGWFFDGIAVVTPEIEARFPKKKTILLRNFPVVSLIDEASPSSYNKKDKFIVIYVGVLTKVRGIEELINAFSFLDNSFELWLFGNWESESFKNSCESSPGWSKVVYFGNLSQKEVYSFMKIADVGIITFLPLGNHNSSMPNKPFEYMACGLPVIMSDFDFWKTTFKDCATFVNPKDSKGIASAIEQLKANKYLKEMLQKKGRSLIENEYSWEAEYPKLDQLYQQILNK
jgi:glycosyltransferase involved in cell wall biosynthesis